MNTNVNAKNLEGDSKYTTFIPVRFKRCTTIAYAIYNNLEKRYRLKVVAPGIHGELPVWEDLKNSFFSDKNEIRKVIRDRMKAAQANVDSGMQSITIVVPRNRAKELREYALELNRQQNKAALILEDSRISTFLNSEEPIDTIEVTFKHEVYTLWLYYKNNYVDKQFQLPSKRMVLDLAALTNTNIIWPSSEE
jgi:hypothetical protein